MKVLKGKNAHGDYCELHLPPDGMEVPRATYIPSASDLAMIEQVNKLKICGEAWAKKSDKGTRAGVDKGTSTTPPISPEPLYPPTTGASSSHDRPPKSHKSQQQQERRKRLQQLQQRQQQQQQQQQIHQSGDPDPDPASVPLDDEGGLPMSDALSGQANAARVYRCSGNMPHS